ncbi:MAG: ATP-binding cassette domain-containing protein, partial [Proteobacteria bacterium]|nr:ATP-binding cassette domain-containing protein [Pseudomonadota bacterium]
EREYQGERILTSVLQDINLNDVAVSYGDETVIDSINLKIRARETLALVGPSGAGKTTLFHLITGLISPDKGDITIGGIDYKELEKSSLRNKIGYVTQDPVIINDTVGNNIAFWECQPDDKVCSEHIYWDQASVLVQIGLLQTDGLPVTGSQAAKKLLDPTLPSNQLMGKSWTDR